MHSPKNRWFNKRVEVKKSKVCTFCGRSFEFRKKWTLNWEEIQFCSDRCRNSNKGKGKKELQSYKEAILSLLNERTSGKTICPSEVLPAELKTNKEKMEAVRQAARQLAHANIIEITQSGKPVDPDTFRGPIRLRKRQ